MSAGVLLIVLAVESFEAPAMIGEQGGIFVLTTSIVSLLKQFPPDLSAAGALGIALLILSAVFVLLGNIGKKGARSYQTVSGKAFRPRPIELTRTWRVLIGGISLGYFFVGVVAPLAALVYSSLLPTFRGFSISSFGDFTLEHYRSVLQEPNVWDATWTTILLAVASATLVMCLTVVASWFTQRSQLRGRSIVEGAAFVPLVIPGVVLGMALTFVYLRFPVAIYGTLLLVIIGYTTRFMPFGMRYSGSSIGQIGNELEESAYVSGASWWQSLRRIVAPLAVPGIMGGWIFVMVVAFRELSVAILIVGNDVNLLSVMLYAQFIDGLLTTASAIGVLMVLVMLALIVVVYRLGARAGIRLH
jgi:iron(III) transport system permease protein